MSTLGGEGEGGCRPWHDCEGAVPSIDATEGGMLLTAVECILYARRSKLTRTVGRLRGSVPG